MASCQGWTPQAAKKRNAFVAHMDDNFDEDCGPAPPKLSAVDHEVAHEVLKGGYYYDPSNRPPPSQPQTKVLPMEEDAGCFSYTSSAPLPPFPIQKQPGDSIDKCGVTQPLDLDGRECRELVTHSMHASQSKSPSSNNIHCEALTKKGLTLVLSNEIQETLSSKMLSDDCLLPRLLPSTSPSSSSNSMMLVEWKPRPTNPLDYFLKRTKLGENLKIRKKQAQPSTHSVPIHIDNPDVEEETCSKMDIDVL